MYVIKNFRRNRMNSIEKTLPSLTSDTWTLFGSIVTGSAVLIKIRIKIIYALHIRHGRIQVFASNTYAHLYCL